jgi:transposase-like protein
MDFPIADLMDEGACYARLVAWLHPDGLACPRCGERDRLGVHRRHRAPVLDYRCKACRRVFNAFTDTLLHGIRRRPSELVLVVRGIAQGVTTARLARELGCDRSELLELRHRLQHAAWAFRDQTRLPDEVVEADEMYQNAGEKRGQAHRPGRPAAAARQPPPRPRELGQRPAAGVRGGGARQRAGPPGGDPDLGDEAAEPGGAGGGDAARPGEHRRVAGV